MSGNSSSDSGDLLELVEPIARETARRYAHAVPHLDYDDVVGELILAQVCAIQKRRYRPFLKRVARNRAIDLIRIGRRRKHDELDRVLAEGEDGEGQTLGDWLARNGHPELTRPSAEHEYLVVEARRRIDSEIPRRARAIGVQCILREPTSGADNTYISSFRKAFPAEKKADLFDYIQYGGS